MASQSFPKSQTIAVVTIAVVAGCVPPLQPMLLGGLLAEGRIGAAAMGYAAAAEGLGMVIGTTLASALLAPRRLRLIAVLALLAVMAANVMTIAMPPPGIIAARGLSGLGNGILFWVFVGMLARSELPTRLFGTYYSANAALVFLTSVFLASSAAGRSASLLGYGFLITLYVPLLLAIRFAPNDYADIRQDNGGLALPPLWGFSALAAVILFLAGVMSFWIYSVPLGHQAGIATQSMKAIVGAGTGVQILGGLAAISLATRLSGTGVVIFTAGGGLLAVMATLTSSDMLVWASAVSILAFCWMFGLPFHIAFLNDADPTRRASMFVGTAQLVGLTIGPLLASPMISARNYVPASYAAIGCFALALLLAVGIGAKGRFRRFSPA